MFERYTERARRVLFFARYEASQFGAVSIETEHLLLGLAREGRGMISRIFAQSKVSPEEIRKEVENRFIFAERIPTSVEIPFSNETKQVLGRAAEESDHMGVSYIGTEHLLLGLLHDEKTLAGSILAAHGLRLAAVRNDLVAALKEKPTGGVVLFNPVAQNQHIDHIKGLVEQLGQAAGDGSESQELKERLVHEIMRELDALKLPPGDWPNLTLET